jgi:hypothetical protein
MQFPLPSLRSALCFRTSLPLLPSVQAPFAPITDSSVSSVNPSKFSLFANASFSAPIASAGQHSLSGGMPSSASNQVLPGQLSAFRDRSPRDHLCQHRSGRNRPSATGLYRARGSAVLTVGVTQASEAARVRRTRICVRPYYFA